MGRTTRSCVRNKRAADSTEDTKTETKKQRLASEQKQVPTQPHWKHDCDRCTYLGTLRCANGEITDLYLCQDSDNEYYDHLGTVRTELAYSTVRRYGPEPDDCSGWSGEGFQPLYYHLAQSIASDQKKLQLAKCDCGDTRGYTISGNGIGAPNQCAGCLKDRPYVLPPPNDKETVITL